MEEGRQLLRSVVTGTGVHLGAGVTVAAQEFLTCIPAQTSKSPA